jgi:hypothetical protein
VLNNCDACHSLATTLLTRKPADGWVTFLRDHRDSNLPAMTDAELQTLTAYIAANFNTDVPYFNIPPQLLFGQIIVPY